MARCDARCFLLVVVLSGVGCDGGSSAITDLTMELPPGDRDARTRLDGVEVEVWDPSVEACRALIGWRRAVCGRACEPPPSPRDEGESPRAEISLEQLADGTFGMIDLVVPGDGPWEVVVRGLDDAGDAFLHGCTFVTSEQPANVRLFRPWCDTAACAGQLHPACPAEIDCTAEPGDDPDGLGPPSCRPLVPVVYAWEQGGVACDPTGTGYTAPCRQARVDCSVGLTEPAVDGVCPRASDPACGGTLADDLDCDGHFPGPCGPCSDGEMQACGTGACAPIAVCGADGTFGDCELPTGTVETCGGGDEDCDGLDDAMDGDAFAACNAGRTAAAPAADACDAALGCRCGTRAACAAGTACCAGACVSLASSASSCGACGRACAPTETCVSGVCTGSSDGGVCTVAACNAGRTAGRPRADRCNAAGNCACGAAEACSGTSSCCGGRCQDLPCPPDGGIIDGCEPTPEQCDGADTNCNGVPDSLDPAAFESCNDGLPVGAPRASECAETGCRCGDGPACDVGAACCTDLEGTSCVPLGTDANCGGCGDACDGGQTCVGSECRP